MKFKTMLSLIIISALFACGTTNRVITDDGKVYEIKGDEFFNNDKNVTEQLSSD